MCKIPKQIMAIPAMVDNKYKSNCINEKLSPQTSLVEELRIENQKKYGIYIGYLVNLWRRLTGREGE